MSQRHHLAAAVMAIGVLLAVPTANAETIKIGVSSGPHAEITAAAIPVAKAKGLDIQLVEFSDGSLIDQVTYDGELDANAFQHTPYLDQQNHDRGLDLVSVGRTILLPMAGYSRKVKSIADLPAGAQISIPNDPTNGGRALKLLEANGIVKLAPGSTFNATELDIVDNPKSVKILPMETAQLPRSLEDVDFSVITSFFALAAGLNPGKDGLIIESQQSDYFCLIAVKPENKDKAWVKTLVESYQSPEVKAFINKTYAGNIIAGW
jgi:D-methionine transport system substrate-binding protein